MNARQTIFGEVFSAVYYLGQHIKIAALIE
jgi:hypothetical protein